MSEVEWINVAGRALLYCAEQLQKIESLQQQLQSLQEDLKHREDQLKERQGYDTVLTWTRF